MAWPLLLAMCVKNALFVLDFEGDVRCLLTHLRILCCCWLDVERRFARLQIQAASAAHRQPGISGCCGGGRRFAAGTSASGCDAGA